MADEQAPTLDELRAVAPALPPDHRLQGSEVADVLSAVVAFLTHGRSILDAAQEGGDAVYKFLHDHIASNAPEGADEPQRGYVHAAAPPAAPAVATGTQQIDYDKLAAAIVTAQHAHESSPTTHAADAPGPGSVAPVTQDESVTSEPQAQPAPVTASGEGVAASPEAPAGVEPEAPQEGYTA